MLIFLAFSLSFLQFFFHFVFMEVTWVNFIVGKRRFFMQEKVADGIAAGVPAIDHLDVAQVKGCWKTRSIRLSVRRRSVNRFRPFALIVLGQDMLFYK